MAKQKKKKSKFPKIMRKIGSVLQAIGRVGSMISKLSPRFRFIAAIIGAVGKVIHKIFPKKGG